MTDFNVVWIVQLTKEMKEFFETLAIRDGDEAYGAGARYVKRVLSNFKKDYEEASQAVREE
jgi:hypothetical protein